MMPGDDVRILQAQLSAAALDNTALKLQVATLEKQLLQKQIDDLTAQVAALTPPVVTNP